MQRRYYPREPIRIGRLGVLLLIAAFVFSGCGGNAVRDETGAESLDGESDVTFTGVITEVQDGTDGSTVRLQADDATTVWATVSIPNLGPDSDFDFSALVVGSAITVTGEPFEMDGETWLTAQWAAVVETAAGGETPQAGEAPQADEVPQAMEVTVGPSRVECQGVSWRILPKDVPDGGRQNIL